MHVMLKLGLYSFNFVFDCTISSLIGFEVVDMLHQNIIGLDTRNALLIGLTGAIESLLVKLLLLYLLFRDSTDDLILKKFYLHISYRLLTSFIYMMGGAATWGYQFKYPTAQLMQYTALTGFIGTLITEAFIGVIGLTVYAILYDALYNNRLFSNNNFQARFIPRERISEEPTNQERYVPPNQRSISNLV